ncbi:MAG: 7-cyano-7-deazaguanine synthase [bacterium]|nr:7-cyano-7-deazaguanine synthase [bacterium]
MHDPDFWNSQKELIGSILQFLTTDIWKVQFVQASYEPKPPKHVALCEEKSVMLLSGGLDSLVGALDLVAAGIKPVAVSQTVKGDGEKQLVFASSIGGGLTHLQLNHNVKAPKGAERSQRARSFIFLTYGVLAATALPNYQDSPQLPMYVCENGLIAINPPLTDTRIGSLSTRTTHPTYLSKFQKLLDNAKLFVSIRNPYEFKTKGEMLSECGDQDYLINAAHVSTSCGRFARHGMKHCGRCVPCLIRRAAFQRWEVADRTQYLFADLSKSDKDHAQFDDVRALSMAVSRAKNEGVDAVLGASLLSDAIDDPEPYRGVVERGLAEVRHLLEGYRVR